MTPEICSMRRMTVFSCWLLDISSALSTTKTFVLGLNTRSTEDGFAIIRIEIQIKDGAQLSTLMNKLHQISGVLQVNRPVG